jgi:hypothetical protein
VTRTPDDWDLPESDLYVGGRPLTAWEAHRASVVVLVVLGCLLVAWLVWGGRGV